MPDKQVIFPCLWLGIEQPFRSHCPSVHLEAIPVFCFCQHELYLEKAGLIIISRMLYTEMIDVDDLILFPK